MDEYTDEDPQDEYDTTYVYIRQDENKVDQEYHEEHNNSNIDPPQYDNHDAPQEQDIATIEDSIETAYTVHEFPEQSNHPVNRMQVVCQL